MRISVNKAKNKKSQKNWNIEKIKKKIQNPLVFQWKLWNGGCKNVVAFKWCWFWPVRAVCIYLTFVIAGGVRQTVHIISPTGMGWPTIYICSTNKQLDSPAICINDIKAPAAQVSVLIFNYTLWQAGHQQKCPGPWHFVCH